jgi:hypothetical protein
MGVRVASTGSPTPRIARPVDQVVVAQRAAKRARPVRVFRPVKSPTSAPVRWRTSTAETIKITV